MNKTKLRNLLVLIHLYTASVLVPFILMVAVTGALKAARIDAEVVSSPIVLPATASLDFKSPSIEDDIRALLKQADIDIEFEYVRGRGNGLMTRPTSRPFVQFSQTPNGLTAKLQKPNLHYRLFELHKGHGPTWFRYYQIFAGIGLFLIVLGGVVVGLLSKAYRKPTVISTVFGTILFLILGFMV